MSRNAAAPIAQLFNLSGRTAVVTGAAVGLGFAIASRLAEAGAAVMLSDINRETLDKAVRDLTEKGYHVQSFIADAGREENLIELFQNVEARLGGIDILVNNAGIYPVAGVLEMTAEQWRDVMCINLESAFVCTREAGRLMVKQGRGGAIINLSSLAGFKPCLPGLSHYGASKGGIANLTRSTALELAPHKIRANAIAPGVILTEGMKANLQPTEGTLDDQLNSLGSTVPLGAFADPDEIAKAVLFLVSDAAAYITGTTLTVDGGAMLV